DGRQRRGRGLGLLFHNGGGLKRVAARWTTHQLGQQVRRDSHLPVTGWTFGDHGCSIVKSKLAASNPSSTWSQCCSASPLLGGLRAGRGRAAVASPASRRTSRSPKMLPPRSPPACQCCIKWFRSTRRPSRHAWCLDLAGPCCLHPFS